MNRLATKKELREAPETITVELSRKLWLRLQIATMITGTPVQDFAVAALEGHLKSKMTKSNGSAGKRYKLT